MNHPPTPSQSPTPDDSGPSPSPHTVPVDAASPVLPTSPATAVSGTVGAYDLLEVIQQGGMGIVYLARHRTLGRLTALKTLRTDTRSADRPLERFDREMRAAARLRHPNIVPIYEVGTHQGRPYFAMAYLPGGNLASRRHNLSQDPNAVLALVEKVARAVHYAHERGVLHRDLKPANVLLDENGEPLVADFGLAKLHDETAEATQTGFVMGTPAYMAPEQAAGNSTAIGPWTDVWALGIMLYELLADRRPFVAEQGEDLRQKIRDETPPPLRTVRTEVNPDVEAVVARCLEKAPHRRYATALDLADALARCRGATPPARPRRHRLRQLFKNRNVRIGAVILAALALGGLTMMLLSGNGSSPTEDLPPTSRPEQLVLLGESGPPAPLRWLAGERGAANLRRQPDLPFGFHTDQVALVELLPRPPWPHFHFEAQVRHEHAAKWSQVGLFFAHRTHDIKGDLVHGYWRVGFADLGSTAGQRTLAASRLRGDPAPLLMGSLAVSRLDETFERLPVPPGALPPWRLLAVDVTGLEVQAFLDGKPFAHALLEGLNDRIAAVLDDFPRVPHVQGGLGIYVSGGSASFKAVVLKRLP